MPNIKGWKDIDWKIINRYVDKMQNKIYLASKSGNVREVRRLQHIVQNSFRCKLSAIRRVTQDNSGKKTAGIDGNKSLTPTERFALAKSMKLNGKAKKVRRVEIPKSNGKVRKLGIPTIEDRAKQALAHILLDPEWEAKFSNNSYGFRKGRTCHDAISDIYIQIGQKPNKCHVYDADIKGCFDNINHDFLLNRLNTYPKLRRQIRSWLKSGVQVGFNNSLDTYEGTPQGGVISPLLANIALDYFDKKMDEIVEKETTMNGTGIRKDFSYVRYADDFVLIKKESEKACIGPIKRMNRRIQGKVEEALKPIGLEISQEKTKWTKLNEGFDFLGFNVRTYKVGKYRANKSGCKILIKPTKKAIQEHYRSLAETAQKLKNAPKIAIISGLNPIIRGWCQYYQKQVSARAFAKLDHMVHKLIMRILHYKCPKTGTKKIVEKYFEKKGDRNWCFGNLLWHRDTKIERHVKVRGDKSPYDGDTKYWGQRLSKYNCLTEREKHLLKRQKGNCAICGEPFKITDTIEVDHIKAKCNGGSNTWSNLQLVHKHCHETKTPLDIKEKRENGSRLG